jgi:hypothetical protein
MQVASGLRTTVDLISATIANGMIARRRSTTAKPPGRRI